MPPVNVPGPGGAILLGDPNYPPAEGGGSLSLDFVDGGDLTGAKTLNVAGMQDVIYVGRLTGNTALTVINATPPVRIEARLLQDGVGGHTFTVNGTAVPIPMDPADVGLIDITNYVGTDFEIDVGGQMLGAGTVRWKAGRYYAPPGAVATGAPSASTIEGCLLAVEPGRTIDRIGFELTTVFAPSTLRPLLFADDGGYPGALLLDSGTAVDTSAGVGLKEVTVNFAIPDDALYVWAMVHCLSGTPTVRRVNTTLPNTSIPGTAAGVAIGTGGYFATGQATVPGTFPAGATQSANLARVFVRAA